MILKLWCKGTNKREDYNGINAEPLTNTVHIIVEKLAMDSIRERLRFHEGVSLFIGLRGIN